MSDSVCSERKLEANRLNAQQSTGPRSDSGKVRSSRNAFCHGFFSSVLLLPGEDAELLESLRAGIGASLKPADAVEELLVERIVAASWKLRRLQGAEQALYTLKSEKHLAQISEPMRLKLGLPPEEMVPGNRPKEWRMHKPDLPAGVMMALLLEEEDSQLMKHQMYGQRLEASIHRSLRQLEKLKKNRDARSADSCQTRGSEVMERGLEVGGGGSELVTDRAEPADAVNPGHLRIGDSNVFDDGINRAENLRNEPTAAPESASNLEVDRGSKKLRNEPTAGRFSSPPISAENRKRRNAILGAAIQSVIAAKMNVRAAA